MAVFHKGQTKLFLLLCFLISPFPQVDKMFNKGKIAIIANSSVCCFWEGGIFNLSILLIESVSVNFFTSEHFNMLLKLYSRTFLIHSHIEMDEKTSYDTTVPCIVPSSHVHCVWFILTIGTHTDLICDSLMISDIISCSITTSGLPG